MRTPAAWMAGLILVTGCAQPEAVWLFRIGDSAEIDRSTTCRENFLYASCDLDELQPQDEMETTIEYDGSDGVFFGQIVDCPDGNKALVFEGEVYPGTRHGSAWVFSWTWYRDRIETQTHDAGYDFDQTTTYSTEMTFDLEFVGETAEGTLLREWGSRLQATESDTWDAQRVGQGWSQLDAGHYLTDWTHNYDDRDDCGGNTCRLEVQVRTTSHHDVQAERTDVEPSGFEGVAGAQQHPGSFDTGYY